MAPSITKHFPHFGCILFLCVFRTLTGHRQTLILHPHYPEVHPDSAWDTECGTGITPMMHHLVLSCSLAPHLATVLYSQPSAVLAVMVLVSN